MGSVASGNEPSIAFPRSMSMESKSLEQEEPMANQPLHTQEWNVPEELPPIPSDYSLGYSHAVVHGASPQTVANRIVEGLAEHSVAVVPHDSHEVRSPQDSEATVANNFTLYSHSPFLSFPLLLL